MVGGLGVGSKDEKPAGPADWARGFVPRLAGRPLKLYTEPGRAIAGNAGILVTRVELLKTGEEKSFAVVDAAMNDLLRPTLYQAWMDIIPVREVSAAPARKYDVVGPVCESGDWRGRSDGRRRSSPPRARTRVVRRSGARRIAATDRHGWRKCSERHDAGAADRHGWRKCGERQDAEAAVSDAQGNLLPTSADRLVL